MKKWCSFLAAMLLGAALQAQHPMKVEVLKIAASIVLPPLSAAEAYQKNSGYKQQPPLTMFNQSEDRLQHILSNIASRTQKQVAVNDRREQVARKAYDDGINDMSAGEMADYLRKNPELARQTGVDPSALELAAKMQDPAFRKKFEAMSDAEKVAMMQGYSDKSAQAAAAKSNPGNVRTQLQASQIVHQFQTDYKPKDLVYVERRIQELEDDIDRKMHGQLDSLQQKRNALPSGKGATAADIEQAQRLFRQMNACRELAWERKLKAYREVVSSSLSLFKTAAAPFDQYMAKINYGNDLDRNTQVDLLAQLGGFQDSFIRILYRLQELCKDVTLRAAAFYETNILSSKDR
jgi:hypothetical protein